MIIKNPRETSEEQEKNVAALELSVNSSAEFRESQLHFLHRSSLERRDCLAEEVPVMHQRSALVAFFSEMLEVCGLRKYDHEYDIDDSSIGLELGEDERQADDSALHEESMTCDMEKNYPQLTDSEKDGGGGVVVAAAEDLQFGRRVAIKSLKNFEDSKARSAFFAEARITARLEHPAIVPVHNIYVDHANVPHLAMKYVEGKSFRERIEKIKRKYARLNWYRICTVERWQRKLRIEHFLRVCEAIEYAHNRNVLHRDLKPENIMVGRFGELYVMGWKMARVIPKGRDWVLSPIAGSLRYIAPEMLQNRPYGKTADIYQLGLLLYETVFLRRAFPWRDREVVMEHVKTGELSPMVHYFGCYVPGTLKRIIKKATALDPLDRYQEVRDLASDLRGFLKNEATSVERFPRLARFARVMGRYGTVLLAVALVVVTLCCGGAIAKLRRQVAKQAVLEQQDYTLKRLSSSNRLTGFQIEREVVNVENDLLAMCREAGVRLENPEAPNSLYHYYRGTEGFAENPRGYEYQPAIGKNVSFRAFGWHVPNDTEEIPSLDSILSTLYPMLPAFVKITTEHFRNAQDGHVDMTEECTPVVSTMLGFQNELLFAYPFEGHRPPEFHVTRQEWYTRAIEDFEERPVWIGPVADTVAGDHVLMYCSAPVVNGKNERIGAGVTVLNLAAILDLYAQRLFVHPEVKAHYLVHFEGDIYATDQSDLKPSSHDGTLVFHPFPYSESFAKMGEMRTGQVFLDEKEDTLFIYIRIEPLKCVYIEEVDVSLAAEFVEPGNTGGDKVPAETSL